MKKRVFAVILAGLMTACALAACSGSEENTESSGTIVLSSADEKSEASEEKTESKEESKTESKTESKEESKEKSKAESSEDAESSEEESSEPSEEESEEESSEPVDEQGTEDSAEESLQPEPSSSEAPVQSVGFSEADMSFVYNNAYIAPNDNMSEVIAKIGNANSVQSAPSCIGVGEDKIYNYGSFTIESYPASDGEKVLNIMITDSSVSTSKGISVGMSAADIKEVYGEPTEGDDYFISYKADARTHLDFIMDGSSIMEIDYVYNAAG